MNSFFKGIDFELMYDSLDIQVTKNIRINEFPSIKFKEFINNIYHGDSLKGLEKGEYRYINITNLSTDGIAYYDGDKFVNTSPENKAVIKSSDVGSLLVSRSRNPGVFVRITEAEIGKVFGSFIIKIDLKEEHKKNSEYLVLYLNSPLVQEYVKSKVSGGVGGNINQGVIKNIPVVSPEKIDARVEELVFVKEKVGQFKDKIISLYEKKNNNTLFRIIDKVFESEICIKHPSYMLDKYNQINGGESKIIYNTFDSMSNELDYIYNTPFNIPKEIKNTQEWVYLNDLLEQNITTGTYGKKVDEKTGFCRIMVKNLSSEDERMKTGDVDNILEVDFSSASVVNRLKYGDILFSGSGAGGLGNMVINLTKIKGIIDSHVGIIRLKESVNQLFLYYYLTSYLGQQQILRCVTGTTGQISINLNKLKRIVVPLLSNDKMEEIIEKIKQEKQHGQIYDKKINDLQLVLNSSIDRYVLNGFNKEQFKIIEEVMM